MTILSAIWFIYAPTFIFGLLALKILGQLKAQQEAAKNLIPVLIHKE